MDLGIGDPPQVAAVCYRANGCSVEFLLVNTSSGKWTFPKGRLEIGPLAPVKVPPRKHGKRPGVAGSIEGESLRIYLDTKRLQGNNSGDGLGEITIAAYLMEVHSAVVPRESGRNPVGSRPQEAKRLT